MTSTGSSLSEGFIAQISDKEIRDEYVADQLRLRIALMIRSLREQRGWTQKQLAERMKTSQSVVSRIEDADYGKLSIQTLLEVASACDLPLLVDLPEWQDWFSRMQDFSAKGFERQSFDPHALTAPKSTKKNAATRLQRAEPIFYGSGVTAFEPSEPYTASSASDMSILWESKAVHAY